MRSFFSILILLLGMQNLAAQVLLERVSPEPGRYIVSFSTESDSSALKGKGAKERRQVMADLRQQMALHIDSVKSDMIDTDLKIVRALWLRQSAAIHLSPRFLSKLKSLPYVIAVNPDRKFQIKPQAALSLSGENVGDDIARIDIDTLWSEGYRGQGVVVAILDTGVDYLHKDLRDRWRGGSNSWFDPYGEFTSPVDTYTSDGKPHGTGVTSLVLGGNLNETSGYLGVAPAASWIAARIINGDSTTESAIISALEWVLDPDGDPATDDYPDIVQNSWGMTGASYPEGSCTNPFQLELSAIDDMGIDIVFSVGNTSVADTPSSYLSPSFDKNVISVGAINSADDTVWANSARGPDTCNAPANTIPSLVAPGQSVTMADETFGGLSSNLDNVTHLSGTSFAAPMVSGALALLRSKYQVASSTFLNDEHWVLRQALYDSTLQLGSVSPNDDYGRGLTQASAAAALLETEAGKTSPSVTHQAEEVNFSTAKYVVSEDGGSVDITVYRSGDISSAASVQVVNSNNGTANVGSDYEAVNSTVEFLEMESQKTVTVTLIDDSYAENTETFELVFTGPNTINIGSRNSITVSISDDETASAENPEDVIGGSAFGMLEIFFLLSFAVGRLVIRWV